MSNPTVRPTSDPSLQSPAEELSDDQLEDFSGGIIIVSGVSRLGLNRYSPVALNPQPLPPSPYKLMMQFRF